MSKAYLTPQQIEHYHREGYLQLPAVYSPEEIQSARQLIEADRQTGWASAPYHDEGVTTDIYERIPALTNIIFNANYLAAMRELFAPDPHILAEPAVHRSRYYYWHKDSTFIDEQGDDYHWQTDFQAAMTVLYLQANHPDYGGGISVVPHTHHDPDFYHRIPHMSLAERAVLKAKKIAGVSHFDRLDKHRDLTPIPTEAGDLLVLDMRLDHKGTPAKKPAPVTKYGIMNIACSGAKTAGRLRASLRRRPSGYYKDYLLKQPETTPELRRVEDGSGLRILL